MEGVAGEEREECREEQSGRERRGERERGGGIPSTRSDNATQQTGQTDERGREREEGGTNDECGGWGGDGTHIRLERRSRRRQQGASQHTSSPSASLPPVRLD